MHAHLGPRLQVACHPSTLLPGLLEALLDRRLPYAFVAACRAGLVDEALPWDDLEGLLDVGFPRVVSRLGLDSSSCC